MISVQQKFCDTLKSLHREFIWNGKRAKIKHSSLIGEYRDGGLKDVDVDAKILSLKISWIRKLKDSNFHPWKVLANHLLSKVGGETIFHANGEELKNWETVSQEFNLNPVHFLKWYRVLKSIPSSWKKALRSHSVEESMISEESQYGIEANGKFIPINCVTAKLVYNLCISHKFSPPTSVN